MRWRRIPLLAIAMTVAGLLGAASAQATFHLIKVREVYPGSNDGSGFVELQMYASGQNMVAGHEMTLYDSTGTLIHTSTFQANVANAENQRTILIGGSNVASLLRIAPDLVDPGLSIPASGGAACWNADGNPSDCVSWGNFSGADKLPNPTGSPIAPGGIGQGEAILRRIEPGCPTLLEASDDTDDSATDFEVLRNSPNPRNNSMTPTEQTCAGAPETAIDDRPPQNSNSADAEFTYEAPTATSYECRLDSGPFASCPSSGKSYSGLLDGSHSFEVRGVNASGPDPTPASYTWTVDTVAPTTTIDTHPDDPSPGASAAFTFHASEATIGFECSLTTGGEADAFSPCDSGKTYLGLADGAYTFKLRATDLAGNPQATPTAFSWRVDNSGVDMTPPETTIVAKPPDPSASATASFAYGSNEPGSRFECSLDGAPFAACPPGGISYPSLANGAHTFQVRAVDPTGNVDPTPAGYTFSVQVESTRPPGAQEPPRTVLVLKPAKRTSDGTPTFRFRAAAPGASFQCAVDSARFRACRSPFTTARLKPGRHTFSVRAVTGALVDPTPVEFTFQVVKKRG